MLEIVNKNNPDDEDAGIPNKIEVNN